MGREWNWGGGGKSSRREDKGGGGEGGRREEEETKGKGSLPSGCMCAVFQWFDFHQTFQFATNNTNIIQHQLPPPPPPPPPFKPNSFLSEDSSIISTGVEGPRNILELADSSFPSTTKEVERLDTQMGIQIKTSIGDHKKSPSKALCRDQPSDTSFSSSDLINPYSPGSKTPNLVARLMGLDLLPDSPSSTSALVGPPTSHYHLRVSNNKQPFQPKPNDFSGTRSLPETPRISSARRSDVDHRLSLQINKENMSLCEELVLSRISSALRRKETNLIRKEGVVSLQGKSSTSPGNLAKQIVKQVKESVSRRVGLDITNNVSNSNKLDHQSREFNDHHWEYSKKVSKVSSREVINSDRCSSSTCSPRLRLLDTSSKLSNYKDHVLNDVSNFTPNKPNLEGQEEKEVVVETRGIVKGKQEKLSSKAKRPVQTRLVALRNKQEEPFVRPTTVVTRANASIPDQKKCKRMPLSNGLLTTMAPPTGHLPVKRDPTPPATKIPHKQVSNGKESIRRPQSYKLKEETHMLHVPGDNTNANKNNSSSTSNISATTTTAPVPEDGVADRDYVITVLKRTGLHKDSQVSSFTRWFSPSHPLDPSIFYYLEHFTDPGQLSQRCNRKLVFQLVDEILADILRPCIDSKPWVGGPIPTDVGRMKGLDLVDLLCTKIRSFPTVDCRVLDDIDGLIDGDLLDWKGQRELCFEEEGEGIVSEIEKDVLDTLVHETAVVLYSGLSCCGFQQVVGVWYSGLDRKGRRSHGSFT